MALGIHVERLGGEGSVASLVPGLALTAAIAAAAMLLRQLSGWSALSPLIVSIVLGMAFNAVMAPPAAAPGTAFAMRRLLRAGIVLLGLQVTLPQLLSLGAPGMAAVALTLGASFVAIRTVGRWIGVDPRLADLIAAGTSVCGASAVIAANTVVRARDEDVAYAIACVTLFGTLSMLLYPLLAGPLQLGAAAYGLWSGATIHEVGQVVAAAFQQGDLAGQFGTVAKLGRVVLLAPLVMLMALSLSRGEAAGARAPMPWFVLGFVAMMLVNSAVAMPPELRQVLVFATNFLLSMALAAMGMHADMRKLRAKGLAPLALGAFGWLFIAGFGLAAVRLAGF